jgi:IS5 family transposase
MSLKAFEQLQLSDTYCDQLVAKDHPFRKIDRFLDLKPVLKEFEHLYSKEGAPGIPLEKGIRMLILQFLEGYSDRQMEQALKENIAVKWFCGYELKDATPDHSYFGKLRKRLGTENVAKIFNFIVGQMRNKGVVGNAFTFIDATGIITKTALWEERDRAIKEGVEKLNNEVVGKYSADSEARFGCKGKKKFWFGYKRHVGVDMKSGMITKVAVTPANVSDSKALKHVCPKGGMVLADKGYCGKEVEEELRKRGCHSGVIKRNNMKGKNVPKDQWLTKVRMPFENVFSKLERRSRYRRRMKVQYQAFMEAIAYNLKRWVKIETAMGKVLPC